MRSNIGAPCSLRNKCLMSAMDALRAMGSAVLLRTRTSSVVKRACGAKLSTSSPTVVEPQAVTRVVLSRRFALRLTSEVKNVSPSWKAMSALKVDTLAPKWLHEPRPVQTTPKISESFMMEMLCKKCACFSTQICIRVECSWTSFFCFPDLLTYFIA